ncbi:hypothetical protein DEO72_LG9g1475 [Vigna unguiculata]|uniref:Uncharacterized protein n=1 Tax=Vigna unguiculata TaxID=3917 RepID=A0A4D6MYC7_VIGUN|nr:hypothetical protein DEO72_LG9g1475 [Vigna unguiculata]
MGSTFCVAAKDPNLPNRTRGESLRRDVVYSPSWSFQWGSREHVTGEIENPSYHTSHLDNRNVSMELKGSLSSERGNLSDGAITYHAECLEAMTPEADRKNLVFSSLHQVEEKILRVGKDLNQNVNWK